MTEVEGEQNGSAAFRVPGPDESRVLGEESLNSKRIVRDDGLDELFVSFFHPDGSSLR